ncbi:MAG: hypothetical protein QM831_31695 [Kofleriaceae bacterium]
MRALVLLLGSSIAYAEPIEHSTEVAVAAYGRHVEDTNAGTAPDIDRMGSAFEAKVGYRVQRRVTVGMFAELGGFDRDPAMRSAAQVAAGAYADLHLAPSNDLDPWFELGFGSGYEQLRAQFGVDVRANDHVALAPVVGAAYANNPGEPEWLISAGVLVRIKP